MFAHEQLDVYHKALDFVAASSGFVAQWESKHAVTDQLDRASESLILNLAEAARFHSVPSKLQALDYSMGSCLECAACLDVARIKKLLARANADDEKQRLAEIMRMLVGLRKVWASWEMREDNPADANAASAAPLFYHERLEVYGISLELMEWFVTLLETDELPNRLQRKIDGSLTSVTLNIAEGNGRYSGLDHHRFLDLAACSAVKTAAYLDLAVPAKSLEDQQRAPAKELLRRIVAMLSRM